MSSSPRTISALQPAYPDTLRILVVGARGGVAEQLLGRLRPRGFAVESAADLGAAATALAEERHDALVLEVADAAGVAFGRTAKADPKRPFFPVIGLAGAPGDERLRLAAVRAGFDHWMERPESAVSFDELAARAIQLVHQDALHRASADKTRSLMVWHDWVRYLVHDLRSPVAAAIGNLAFALDSVAEDNADARGALDDARDALELVTGMLQDVLDTDRIRRGALVPRRVATDVAALTLEVVGAQQAAARADGRSIAAAAAGDATASVDPALIARLLANLIGNAVRHARQAPVNVFVHADAAAVTVRVGNDGPAVPAAARARLFEPWVRLDGGPNGTGLGLAFCRYVAEAHGGDVRLESGDEGCVVFALRLPR